ncbi:uncharacterized protein LOC143258411 [Tachypleus tridentatus]|uniref:uncharacterized protein LOC143258411 n=1 Tax=Tachypleus tridentatus TaxID=6853 RepID=UPI003FD62B9E
MTLAQRMRQLPDSYVDNDDIHTDEVLERVEFGNKVLFTFYSEILNAMSERYARKKTCSFVISKNRYFPMVFSFALAKHLPKCFYDKVKFRTEAAFNNLLIDRWLQYHTRNYSKCLGSPSNEKSPLSLKDLESVFIWWIAGISAAFFVICFEFGWTKIEKLHYAVMSSN